MRRIRDNSFGKLCERKGKKSTWNVFLMPATDVCTLAFMLADGYR